MRIEITAGPDQGAIIEPSGERFVVGRDESSDFPLTDSEVSRQHLALRELPDGRVELSDLGSRNGTFVDGQRVTAPVTLSGGEEIKVGVSTLTPEAPAGGGETVIAGGAAAPGTGEEGTMISGPPPSAEPPTPPPGPTAPPPTTPQPTAPPPTTPQPAAAPPPQEPAAPPPGGFGAPPPAPAAGRTGMPTWQRALAAVLALVAGFVAAAVIIGGFDLLNSDFCNELSQEEFIASGDEQCINDSEADRNIGLAIFFAAGLFAAISAILLLMVAIRGRGWIPALVTLVIAGILFALTSAFAVDVLERTGG